jgi:hypothetical protein
MKISDKLYIGFQRSRYEEDENPRILGFAVPYEETKSSEKRRNTVDGWRQDDIDPRTIENKPQKFLRIVDSVVRSTTSNKLFRVLDPKGFELEISAENLLRVIEECTISNGTILEECVWTHDRTGKIYLLPTSTQEYKLHIDGAKKGEKMKQEAGGLYLSFSNGLSVFRFEGIFHHTYMEWKALSTKEDITQHGFALSFAARAEKEIVVQEYELNVNILMNSGKKPSYVYTEFTLDSHGNVSRQSILIRKGLMKLDSEYGGDIMNEMKQTFDHMQFINYTRFYHHYSDRDRVEDDILSTTTSCDFTGLFKDKRDALAFDYTPIIEKIHPAKTRITTIKSAQNSAQSYGYYDRHNTYIVPSSPSKYNIVDKRK